MNQAKKSFSARLPWRKNKLQESNKDAQASSHKPSQNSSKRITYRVQDLPEDCSWDGVQETLEATFGFDKGQSDIIVRSLAYSSGHSGAKTATISSMLLTHTLNENTKQWTFDLLGYAHTAADGQTRPHVIVLDSHFLGLTPLNSVSNQQEHMLDIVAITGLGGHAFTSFKPREQEFMWLRDALPFDLSGAQIWTYGYDSKLTASKSFQDLEALSSTFRRILLSSRHQHTGSRKPVPLVFLGHSLGGLILKEALVQMSQDDSVEMRATYNAIYGILFFGCPNQGMMNIDPFLDWCEGQPNQPFLFTLKHSGEPLRKLCRDFSKCFTFPDSRIISFYETELSPTAAKDANGVWSMTGPPAVLVDASSATHGRPGEDQAHHIQALNRNHSELVKFGRKDVEYDVVLGFLRDFAKSASDAIQTRFDIDRNLLPSAEPDITRIRQSFFATSKDDPQMHDISKWLAPSAYECGHYQDDLEDARSLRHPGTCRWIDARPEFVRWFICKNKAADSLLWIHAIPGAGKTVLASYLVDHMDEPDIVDTQPRPIFYFFCKNADTDKNNALAIAKALAHQILRSPLGTSRSILKELRSQMDSGGHSRAINFRPLFGLICQHLSNLPGTMIIIDAADECFDIEHLLPGLIRLTEKGMAKVVLTSRREPNLVNILQNKLGLGMGPEDVQADIKSFLEYRVSQSETLSDPRVCHRITRLLNVRSKGMFLWVALMIKELDLCSTIEEIEDTLDRLPDGLNEVYERILTRLHDSHKPSRKTFCCRLLKWITLAKRPLHLTEVGEALRIQYAAAVDDFGNPQRLLSSNRELELVCGSLVTVKGGIIQLIHLSTKEFLIDPKRASDSRRDLHAFFVRTQDDSALLSGVCVRYLSDCCNPKDSSSSEFSVRWHMNDTKLLEYTYLNWIFHLTESSPMALVRQESILEEFLTSRTSFHWLEICFTTDRDVHGSLSTHLRAMLDWCSREEPNTRASQSSQGLVSFLHFWAKSYLQLLDDYGPSLLVWPHEVHRIDPKSIFESNGFPILDSLQQDGFYHRHHVMDKIHRVSDVVPVHRTLQKYTGTAEYYTKFFVEERRQVFLILDRGKIAAPSIYCQEIASGKRLTPIIDSELEEINDQIRTCGAALSVCGRYMGIVYEWPLPPVQGEPEGITIYTAIWRLSEQFDFSGAGHPQWARKLVSLSIRAPGKERVSSNSPIAFGDDGFVYCPHGRIDLSSGVQEPIFGISHSCEPLDVIFSGDGRSAVQSVWSSNADLIEEISPTGERTTIYSCGVGLCPAILALSSSGRFLIWGTGPTVYVYNRDLRRAQQLESPPGVGSNIWLGFRFSRDEKLLLGAYHARGPNSGELATQFVVWRQSLSSFRFWAEKTVRSTLAGFCLDEGHGLLYIVSRDRIWSRIDTNTPGLVDLDPDLNKPVFNRIEHEISRDGNRMIILRRQDQTLEVRVVDLADMSELYKGPLKLPGGIEDTDKDPLLVKFSSDLKIVLIGNVLLETEAPNTEPILLPLPQIHKTRDEQWTCNFSACSTYVVLTYNSRTIGLSMWTEEYQMAPVYPAQLLIFRIDMRNRTYARSNTRAWTFPYGKLSVDFHPCLPELVLNSFVNPINYGDDIPLDYDDYRTKPISWTDPPLHIEDFAITTQLLDLEKETAIPLKSPTVYGDLTNGFITPHEYSTATIKYAACGTHVLFASEKQQHMLWPIPSRHPPPVPVLPKVLARGVIYTVHRPSSVTFDDLRRAVRPYRIDTVPDEYYWENEPPLAILPQHLKNACVTFLLGDEPDPFVRALYTTSDGDFEVMHLNFTIGQFLDRLPAYCEEAIAYWSSIIWRSHSKDNEN